MRVPPVPENFLRYIWQRQMSPPARLITSDGRRVVVRFPGEVNRDGGPDFTDASVRIGRTLYRGDVEVHVRAGAWSSHGHACDPHYNRVILHVVLSGGVDPAPPCTASGRAVPLLVLSLPGGRKLYARWLRRSAGEPATGMACPGKNRPIPLPVLRRNVRALGTRRLSHRVRVLGTRLRMYMEESDRRGGGCRAERGSPGADAWEQILYESVLEGMGYAGNSAPFLALARRVPLTLLKAYGLRDAAAMQAILFEAAGLLPGDGAMIDPESRAYVRNLRRRRRALGALRGIPPLHEADWKFFRLRPVNFPSARLAAFCFILPVLFAGHPLERVVAALGAPRGRPPAWRAVAATLFEVSPDGFWSRHVNFLGRGRGGGIAMGRARVLELIVNGIVPVVLLYARVNGDPHLRREALAFLSSLPRPGENSVTRLVKGAAPRGTAGLGTPLEQQGMIHLFRNYCSHRRCRRCPVMGIRTSRRCSRGRTSMCSRR